VTFEGPEGGTKVVAPVQDTQARGGKTPKLKPCTRCGTMHTPMPSALYATFCSICTEQAQRDG
jgi:hypothetical protein